MKTLIERIDTTGAAHFGLQVTLLGETDLEGFFLDHLQRGHSIRLQEYEKYGTNQLRIILQNETQVSREDKPQKRKRNRK